MKCVLRFLLGCCFLWASPLMAAEFPTRTISLIAPFGAGGSSDLAGRAFALSAAQFTGQPLMVINKEGAGGIIGSQWVRTQRPDGYTLLVARVGAQSMVPALHEKSPYAWDQFTMLGLLQLDPVVVLVRPDAPYATLDDLLSAIKAKPNTISYSTSGPFTILALAPQMLLKLAGCDPRTGAKMVPFKGGGEAMTALLGGHVDFLACNLGEAKNQISAGMLRPLAITTTDGFPELASVPLLRDLGFAELEQLSGWTGIYGPERMRPELVAYWSSIIEKVTQDPGWLRAIHELGCIPKYLDPKATKEFAQKQYTLFHSIKQTMQEKQP